MMITLLASVAGFLSSILPELIKLLKDKNDKNHELRIFEKQIDLQKSGMNAKVEEIISNADMESVRAIYSTYKTGITWVDALNGTVRPVLAYSFFTLYAAVKIMQFALLGFDHNIGHSLALLWTVDDQAIFAGIISFYYGQRALSRVRR